MESSLSRRPNAHPNGFHKTRAGIALGLVFVGLIALFYPLVADLVANYLAQRVLAAQEQVVARQSDRVLAAEKAKARAYDDSLAGVALRDPFQPNSGYLPPNNYLEVLNLNQDGVMGRITIPEISVDLPIYHGVSDTVLERGVGHIQHSSTPFGGKGTHAYLSGHRGLPRARLFSDLDQLRKGSVFYLQVLGEVHKYQVFQIRVILPAKFGSTRPTPNQDLVTLVTCTPYGQNTHRLLITGRRVPYHGELAGRAGNDQPHAYLFSPLWRRRFYLPLIVFLCLLGLGLFYKSRKTR